MSTLTAKLKLESFLGSDEHFFQNPYELRFESGFTYQEIMYITKASLLLLEDFYRIVDDYDEIRDKKKRQDFLYAIADQFRATPTEIASRISEVGDIMDYYGEHPDEEESLEGIEQFRDEILYTPYTEIALETKIKLENYISVVEDFFLNIQVLKKDTKCSFAEVMYLTEATIMPKRELDSKVREYDGLRTTKEKEEFLLDLCAHYGVSMEILKKRMRDIRAINAVIGQEEDFNPKIISFYPNSK